MLLNLDQRRIIQAKPSGHAVLRGVAGSGKTMVAIQRVPFLLNHYCFQQDDGVLLLTYNKTLNRYIRYL